MRAMRDPVNTPIEIASSLRPRLERGEVHVEIDTVPNSKAPRATVLAMIDAAPPRVWRLIDETGSYGRTMKGVKRAEELSREGDEVRAKVTIGMPFPLKDLTSVTKAVHTVREGERYCRCWGLESGDYHRNEGSWTLEPDPNRPERTLVRYVIHAEPKIRVPGKLQQLAQKKAIPALIEQLRKLV